MAVLAPQPMIAAGALALATAAGVQATVVVATLRGTVVVAAVAGVRPGDKAVATQAVGVVPATVAGAQAGAAVVAGALVLVLVRVRLCARMACQAPLATTVASQVGECINVVVLCASCA